MFFGKKKKKAEEARKQEEARLAEEARIAAEMKKAEEMRKAEAAKKAEEAAKKAAEEAAKKAAEEAAKKAAEEAAKKAAEEAEKKPAAKKPAAKKAVTKEAEPKKDAEPAKKSPAKKAPAKKPEPVAEAPAEETTNDEIGEDAARTGGKFEIKRANDGSYVFNVRAGNTQIIAKSQTYSSMTACKNGIESVGKNAPVANIEDQTLKTINVEKLPKFQIYLDKAGKYRFNLLATNGNNILSCTQGYNHKSSCKNGIKSVINNATAEVEIIKPEKK